MKMYKYIAESDPNGAISIINSFGYEVVSKQDLGKSLNELVSNVGEPALKKILEYHPDKDVILEVFSEKQDDKKQSCNCPSCMNNASSNHQKSMMGYQDQFFNVSGQQKVGEVKGESTTLAHQTNAILVISALIIATALIVKK